MGVKVKLSKTHLLVSAGQKLNYPSNTRIPSSERCISALTNVQIVAADFSLGFLVSQRSIHVFL